MQTLIFSVALLAACMILAAIITATMRKYALAKMILDIPNERSLHEVATPRGGGISMVFTFMLGTLVLTAIGHLPSQAVASTLLGGGVVAAVGWLDDRSHVEPHYRLVAHFSAAAIALTGIGGLPPIAFYPWIFHSDVIGFAVGAVAIVWLINLYNFMDGIDGLAGVEAVTVAAGAALLLLWQEAYAAAVWLAVLSSSSAGFLIYNWPPAKIFMGDTGSSFLGFTFAVLAVWTGGLSNGTATPVAVQFENAGLLGIWTWLILLGAFLVDASITLLYRLIKRRRLFQAHRSHAYQHAALRLGSHRTVTVSVAMINLLWLLPLAAISVSLPSWSPLLLIVAWAPLFYLTWYFKAGVS